jgi:polyisoprenoid-binding protein YceI
MVPGDVSWWEQTRQWLGSPANAEQARSRTTTLGCSAMRRGGAWLLGLLFITTPATAGLYTIDQRFGTIAFTVSNLDLFHSRGTFRRWQGQLTIDPAHPEQTHIEVVIDLPSVEMSWAEAAATVRSPPFFDVTRYPEAHFVSSTVRRVAPGRYRITGSLQLRGVTQPVTLGAVLTRGDREGSTEIANFVVTGTLHRAAFGMTADPLFISDRVRLEISVRLRLAAPGSG